MAINQSGALSIQKHRVLRGGLNSCYWLDIQAYELGSEGGCCPPQLQKCLKFFGQKADDSGKSTREKIL